MASRSPGCDSHLWGAEGDHVGGEDSLDDPSRRIGPIGLEHGDRSIGEPKPPATVRARPKRGPDLVQRRQQIGHGAHALPLRGSQAGVVSQQQVGLAGPFVLVPAQADAMADVHRQPGDRRRRILPAGGRPERLWRRPRQSRRRPRVRICRACQA